MTTALPQPVHLLLPGTLGHRAQGFGDRESGGRIRGPTGTLGVARLGRASTGEGRPAVMTASCGVTATPFAKQPVTPTASDQRTGQVLASVAVIMMRLQAGQAPPAPTPLLLLLGPALGLHHCPLRLLEMTWPKHVCTLITELDPSLVLGLSESTPEIPI